MNNYFEVNFKARLGNTVGTVKTANGQTVALFTLTPPDELNGTSNVNCIAYGTRAELLERFASRGDLISIKGYITHTDLLLESGKQINESNIIEVTEISEAFDYSEKTA